MFYLEICQCSPVLINKLKGTSGYKEVTASQDGIKIFGMIKGIVCGVEEHLQETWAMVKSDKTLHIVWKNPNKSNDK